MIKVDDTDQSEGGTLVRCGLCEKEFPYKKFLGAFIVDHSMWENTYCPYMICKDCWWIKSELQEQFLKIIYLYTREKKFRLTFWKKLKRLFK